MKQWSLIMQIDERGETVPASALEKLQLLSDDVAVLLQSTLGSIEEKQDE